uniref:Uncharacterized protein n=1 Tax=Anguilla anguilla TaxID=7936 RepID=A0A0E9QQI8_ANGAN
MNELKSMTQAKKNHSPCIDARLS